MLAKSHRNSVKPKANALQIDRGVSHARMFEPRISQIGGKFAELFQKPTCHIKMMTMYEYVSIYGSYTHG